MKFFFPLSLFTIIICTVYPASAQWIRQYPLAKLEDVLDIDISSDGYGFAVGTNDLMLRYNSAVKEWNLLLNFDEGWRLEAVDYLEGSGGNIAAAGGQGLILTLDKGQTWDAIPGAPAGIHTIKLFSPDHMIVVADEGVYKLENDQWTDLNLAAPVTIRGAFILDEQHMWVYTRNTGPAIYSTTDGGNTWNINTDIEDIDLVRFYDTMNGVATDGRKVYNTVNGGVNWTLVSNNIIHNTSNDMTFGSSPNVLMAATLNADPSLSTDGGLTWTKFTTGLINQRSYSIAALSDTEFWLGNDLSSIALTEDMGENWVETSGPDRNIIQDMFFLTKTTGFATGLKGMLLRTFNGGADWEDISFGTRSNFSIHGLDENDLWMGTNQRVLHSVDTGRTWTESLVLIGGNINDVLAISSNRILAASSSGVIYRSNDGGVTWDTVYNAGSQLKSLARIDDQRYMATGFNDVIVRSNNQGETWSPLAVPETGLQYEQAFFLGSTGWLVTSSFKHTMWKTTNAGNTWTPITLPIDRFWDGVYFMSPDTGIVVGHSNTEGRAYITYTGGQSWTAGYITTYPLYGVAGVPHPNGRAWIYGYGSDIEALSYCNALPGITNFMGDLFPCEQDTVTYTISGENIDDYTWSFPATWQILGNANNDTLNVIVGPNSGFITVRGSNSCDITGQLSFSAGADLLPVVMDILGQYDPCEGDLVPYSVSELNVDNFSWSVPGDWSIDGNSNQASILVHVGSDPGIISVTGSNQCGISPAEVIYVDPHLLPTLTFITGDSTPCPGDTVIYYFDFTPGSSIAFFNPVGIDDWEIIGVTPIGIKFIAGYSSGSIQLVASDNCGFSDVITLNLSAEDVPQFIGLITNGGLLSLTYNDNMVIYQWYLNGQPIPGTNNPVFQPTVSGNYYATLLFPSGCEVTSSSVDAIISAIHDTAYIPVRVFPVPAKEKLYLEGIEGAFNFIITDLTGRLIDQGTGSNQSIPVDKLTSGFYLLNILSGEKRYSAKFVRG